MTNEPQHERVEYDADAQDAHEALELRIAKVVADSPMAPREEMQREVHAADEHEDDGDHLDRDIVEMPDARVVSRVAAGRDRREAVQNRIERRHARSPIRS